MTFLNLYLPAHILLLLIGLLSVSSKDQALEYDEGIVFSTCTIETLNTGISRKVLVRSFTKIPKQLLISTLFQSQESLSSLLVS